MKTGVLAFLPSANLSLEVPVEPLLSNWWAVRWEEGGHAEDLHVSRSEVDGEQHIVGTLAQPADDIDSEKIGSDKGLQLT